MPPSKSDTHLTPDEVHEVILSVWELDSRKMFDPCPANADFDGLKIGWEDWNYVNPPYGKIKGERKTLLSQFVTKAIHELETFNHKSIMLLPSKTDQDWYHELVRHGYGIYWFDHRLRFKNNKWSATQPHFMVMIK